MTEGGNSVAFPGVVTQITAPLTRGLVSTACFDFSYKLSPGAGWVTDNCSQFMFALYSLPPSKHQKSRKVDRDLCTKTKETGFLRFLRAVTGLFVHQTRFLTSPGCTPTLLPKKPGCWAPIVSPKPLTRRPFHVTPAQNVKV